MDWLEDFFARKKLCKNAIEISKIENIKDTAIPEPSNSSLANRIRKGEIKPRKRPRRPAFNRAKLPLIRNTRQRLEWLLIPLAIGQFWWLVLLSLPALSAQCNPLYTLDFVDMSYWKLPNSEDLLSWLRK